MCKTNKKYKVSITQTNGITTISHFSKQEIADRLYWWVKDFDKVVIEKEEK